jgi:hypothetical protein
MKATELIAWVGATTGVASLVWNIYTKLTANRPRLAITAFANMVLMPRPQGNPRFLKVTVQNTGTAPTTLTNLTLFSFVPRWERLLSRVKLRKRPAEKHAAIVDYRGPQFPHKLEVGSEWQAIMPQDGRFEDWLETGRLRCSVWHSFSKRPVPAKIVRGPLKESRPSPPSETATTSSPTASKP